MAGADHDDVICCFVAMHTVTRPVSRETGALFAYTEG
jgi:hypothetical protein